MLKKERQSFNLHQADLHNKVLSTDLSQRVNVSDDTIKIDLKELAKAGAIIKVHEGALSPSFHHGNHFSDLEVTSRLRQLRTGLCFLGLKFINLGVSDNAWDVIQIKKTMIESSQKRVCLTEKINLQQPIQVCDIKKIDTPHHRITTRRSAFKTQYKSGHQGFVINPISIKTKERLLCIKLLNN